MGLNTIQTYVPWNLQAGFRGYCRFSIISQTLSEAGLACYASSQAVYMCRVGLGGFPSLVTCHKTCSQMVGSPVTEDSSAILSSMTMEVLSNDSDDKAYLHYLVTLARAHLREDIILYILGSRETLEKGTIQGDAVFSVEKKLTLLSKEMTLVEVESMAVVVFQVNDTWSRATENSLLC
ncbi:hypothetical protein EZV62_003493 [Acer yangbiense]|uniref:Uncharacterized protein n=1 Tax=Acer yangbiense TaxID=1000413 RepID=A0A5C7IHH8_9ROSI|nr:hypothetical protein EZV62_003493 [Acer yangbiense]